MRVKSFKTVQGELVGEGRNFPVALRLVIERGDSAPSELTNYFILGPAAPNGDYRLRFPFDGMVLERRIQIKNGMILFYDRAS